MNNKQFVPASTAATSGTTSINGAQAHGDATSEGRVEVSGAEDGYNAGGSWGGYSGTMVRNPDGTLTLDSTMNGRAADVDRLRGLGAAAANRGAVNTNYSLANRDASRGLSDREKQKDAANLSLETARYGDAQSMGLGRNMLAQGAQAQQAAALSTRGGSLAAAAAMRQQQNGQGAFMQQGNNALLAQQADDMASGRSAYMRDMTAIRAGDAEAERLHTNQGIGQMNNELDQRELGQRGQLGYEEMGQNVNKSALDASLKNEEMKVGIDAAASLRNQRQADRDLAFGAAAAQTGGTLIAGASGLADSKEEGKKKPDPYSEAISTSDYRSKQGVRSLASAAAARGRY